MTARGDARRLDRLLRIHAEDRDVQEDLEHRLLLDVAARRAEGHEESTVGERHRRRRRQARTFARRHDTGVLGIEPALRPAR